MRLLEKMGPFHPRELKGAGTDVIPRILAVSDVQVVSILRSVARDVQCALR